MSSYNSYGSPSRGEESEREPILRSTPILPSALWRKSPEKSDVNRDSSSLSSLATRQPPSHQADNLASDEYGASIKNETPSTTQSILDSARKMSASNFVGAPGPGASGQPLRSTPEGDQGILHYSSVSVERTSPVKSIPEEKRKQGHASKLSGGGNATLRLEVIGGANIPDIYGEEASVCNFFKDSKLGVCIGFLCGSVCVRQLKTLNTFLPLFVNSVFFQLLHTANKTLRTREVPATPAVDWNEQLVFGNVQYSHQHIVVGIVAVHHERETPVGRVTIDFDELIPTQQVVMWYWLETQGSLDAKAKLPRVKLSLQLDKWLDADQQSVTDSRRSSATDLLELYNKHLAPGREALAQINKERDQMTEEEKLMKMKNGDYQIQVHVMEARNLMPNRVTNCVDPVVHVELFDQHQYTSIKRRQRSAVFDEKLFFNLEDMTARKMQTASMRISVLNAEGTDGLHILPGFANDLIGSFQVDVQYVYSCLNHQVSKHWVALHTEIPSHAADELICKGYLQLSVSVLGPGDTIVTEPLLKRPIPRIRLVTIEPINLPTHPPIPDVSESPKFLVITVHEVEDLPNLRSFFSFMSSPYLQVGAAFSGEQILSEPAHIQERAHFGRFAEFQQELWLPFISPSMADVIQLALYQQGRLDDGPLAEPLFLSRIQMHKHPRFFQRLWVNLYGSQRETMPLRSPPLAEKEKVYKGRIMISVREESQNPSRKRGSFTRVISRVDTPTEAEYVLRAIIHSGVNLPAATGLAFLDSQGLRLAIKICVGPKSAITKFVPNRAGSCDWGQLLHLVSLRLPADLSQVPDVFIYLVNGRQEPLAVARRSAADLFQLGFSQSASWIPLESLGRDSLLSRAGSSNDSPARPSLLLRLGFGPSSDAMMTAPWRYDAKKEPVPYQLQVHIFQVQNLPARADGSDPDPYVEISCAGLREKTKIQISSSHPQFYETVILDLMLADLEFAPDLSVEVWDSLRWKKKHLLGFTNMAVNTATLRSPDNTVAPRPNWETLNVSDKSLGAKMLISMSLIRLSASSETAPSPPPLEPPTDLRYIEVIPLGLRSLHSAGQMSVNNPFVQLRITNGTGASVSTITTEPSRSPSVHNPNLIQRLIFPVKLPSDQLFLQPLVVKVKDSRLGGVSMPVLGTATVPLDPDSNREDPLARLSTPTYNSAGRGGGAEFDIDLVAPDSEYTFDDDDDLKQDYLVGRHILSGNLEDAISDGAPFTAVPLFHGYERNRKMFDAEELKTTLRKSDLKIAADQERPRKVGWYKGLLRVVDNVEDQLLADLQQVLSPQPCQVHLYVLRGSSLQPCRFQRECNPYLIVRLGKYVHNTRAKYKKKSTDPAFFSMFDISTMLPGEGLLTIQVWNRLPFGDELIGQTSIDLEARWLDHRWHAIGQNVSVGNKYPPKPVEQRALVNPKYQTPQGNVSLWVDILTPHEVARFDPYVIGSTPTQDFEIRVIVWSTRNVVPMDRFTRLSDMFVKVWLGQQTAQCTDVHWRCRNGRASFKWRMKFPVKLLIDSAIEGANFLHVQIWDKNIVYDKCLADTWLDMTPYFNQAFATKNVVSVVKKQRRSTTSAGRETHYRQSLAAQGITPSNGYGTFETGAGNDFELPERKAAPSYLETNDHASDVRALQAVLTQGDKLSTPSRDAIWLPAWRMQPNGSKTSVGDILLSIDVLPKAIADARPAGYGRSPPNINPILSAPEGRVRVGLLWNPVYVIEFLIGPRIFCALFSVSFIALCIILALYSQELLSVAAATLDDIPTDDRPLVLTAIGALTIGLLLTCVCRFQVAIQSCFRPPQSPEEEAE